MAIIKKIRLKDFKSFASPIELPFDKGFSIILGPNGSGKSNLSDAICFVLGKSSAKGMRAEKSANLIFNGGKEGKPAKEAEVSMFFANNNKEFPIETDEVKITRIVRQSGQSIYKINNETRTRQQILELLGKAGLDPDGYNITLQGDIVRFMEMHPEERRTIIEEIAGISIYEDKKHQAMLELDKVSGKLNEANIILNERKTYLKELEKEKEQAEKFKQLETDIMNNKATYFSMQINEKEDKKNGIEGSIENEKAIISEQQGRVNELKAAIDEKRNEIKNINVELEKKGEIEQINLQKEIEELKMGLTRSSLRLENCSNEVEKLKERKKQLEGDAVRIKERVLELENSRKKMVDDSKLLIKQRGEIENKLNRFDYSSGGKEFDFAEQELERVQSELSGLQNKKNETLRERDKIEFQLNDLNKVFERLDIENLQRLEQVQKKLDTEFNKKLNEAGILNVQLDKTRKELSDSSEELAKLRARNAYIDEEVMGNFAVRKILELNKKGVYGTISQLGKVESKYSMALSVAAGARMHSFVVEDDKIAEACIRFLKENKYGVATFLPLNKIKGRNIEKIEPAITAVEVISFNPRFKEAFSFVFGSTLVVGNIEEARKIGIGRARMVTLDGDLVEQSGAMVGGYRKIVSGVFQEKDLDKRIGELENGADKLKRLIETAEKKRKDELEAIDKLRREKAETEGRIIKLNKSGESLETLKKKKAELINELKRFDTDKIDNIISKKQEDVNNLRRKREEAKNKVSNQKLVEERKTLEEERQRLHEELIKSESEIKNINIQIDSIHIPEIEQIKKKIKNDGVEESRFLNEISELKGKLGEYKNILDEKQKFEKKFHSDFKSLVARRNKLEMDVQKSDEKIEVVRLKIKSNEDKINSMSIARAKIVGELEGLKMEFESVKDGRLKKNAKLDELKEAIKKAESTLRNLGNVNLRALEVYDSLEQEYKKIVEKSDKLNIEKSDVLKMVDEIEGKKKGLFMDVFNALAGNFKKIFESLAVKGEAYLELENSEEPLTAGLDIKVRLTGNKFLDIKSLSGGEKTLTALAFIFAIQEFKPAPFYLLDEVDAALDKTNSEKLSQLISKYAHTAQYIVISHNDAVITEASTIYGVSMQKNGISKVVSLRV